MIFDCDGVLLDSELLSAQILLEELAITGFTADLHYFFENCLGRHFSVVASRIESDSGVAIGAEFARQLPVDREFDDLTDFFRLWTDLS